MNIITQIVTGAVTDFKAAETWIDNAVAKIRGALPASSLPGLDAFVSTVKQDASAALDLVDGALQTSAPNIAKAIEATLDAELVALTNGAALPLVPLVNSGIDKLDAFAASVAHAWALKAKASLTATPALPAK